MKTVFILMRWHDSFGLETSVVGVFESAVSAYREVPSGALFAPQGSDIEFLWDHGGNFHGLYSVAEYEVKP